MLFRYIKIFSLIFCGFALFSYGNDSSFSHIDPLGNIEIAPLSPEAGGITQVEPIAMIGSLEVFDMDFTAAIEAMSIASFDDTPLYPVLIGSAQGNLGQWWENKTAPDILDQYDWSQVIIAESDDIARNDILRFEDNILPYAQWAKQRKRKLILLQGGDFLNHSLENFAQRDDKLLKHYITLSKTSQTSFIPLAHLLARLELNHNITILDNEKRITLKGAWAAAAISYMAIANKRPANPNFSRLYPDLQVEMEPFATIEISERFDIIEAAWQEWQSFLRLVL